jgi:hypothetical protein
MSNELVIEAPEGLPFLDYSREFDAPVSAHCSAPTPIGRSSSSGSVQRGCL